MADEFVPQEQEQEDEDINPNDGDLIISGLGSFGSLYVSGGSTPTSKLQVDGDIRVSGVGTITNLISTNLVGTSASITGISTFRNGPVFIGSATSTGTASQPLQVTGGVYVSGSVGVGTTNPTSSLHIIGSSIITGITTVGLGTTSAPSNSQLTFELTSDTNLRIKVRGTDGILRSANITLA